MGKASGTLIVAQPLDAEQRSHYNLTVEATDGTRTVSTQVIAALTERLRGWWGWGVLMRRSLAEVGVSVDISMEGRSTC